MNSGGCSNLGGLTSVSLNGKPSRRPKPSARKFRRSRVAASDVDARNLQISATTIAIDQILSCMFVSDAILVFKILHCGLSAELGLQAS